MFMIKLLIIAAFLCGSSAIFGQLTQNWNYQNQENPASNGLFYAHEARLGYNFPGRNVGIFSTSALGSYSTYFEKSKIGIGLNGFNFSLPNVFPEKYNESMFKAAVNRQFALNENMIFSVGVAAGMMRGPRFIYVNGMQIKENVSTFTSDFGLAFRWKRLYAAGSINHFLGNGLIDASDFRLPTYRAFASYTFGNSEKFEVIPNLSLMANGGFHNIQLLMLGRYKTKIALGAGYRSNDTFLSTLGYTLFNRFGINYSYEHHFDENPNNVFGRHELSLSLLLNKRNL